ncbi:MAG: T9SS type A sorting domain-containing protein [Bacteroidota bacterium]
MKQIILIVVVVFLNLAAFSQYNPDSFSINNETIKPELKIYPNPCKNNKVTVDFSTKEITEVRLTNIAGKEVLLKKYQLPTHKLQLQLNNIPNGLYIIRIKTSDNKSTVKKLVVSKN